MSRSIIKLVLLAALLPVVAVTTHFAHLQADGIGDESFGELPTFVIPDSQVVRWMALGQTTTAADLFFLRLVQYVGTTAASDAGWPQILPLAELITDLDPDYGYAYEAAGILLSSKQRADESISILEKGMLNQPDRWQLPFFAAYNHWYLLEDYSAGADLLLRVALIPGSPRWVSELASRLYSSAGQIDVGLAYVEAMLASELPTEISDKLALRKYELLIERDLQSLEDAIVRYHNRVGYNPGLLAELVGEEIAALPAAPDGSHYTYDAATGKVSSHRLERRLQVNRSSPTPQVTAVPR